MSEDSRWKSSVTKDLATIHSSLEHVLQTLNLPPLPTAEITAQEPAIFFDQDDQGNDQDEEDRSYDNSPRMSPMHESLTHAPIESLYQITGLRSLRSQESVTEEQNRICKQLRDTDFISRSVITLEDAEYLADYYLTRLDPFIYGLTSDYQDLDSFRRRSPTLTACVLTVSALHDTSRPHLYHICNMEYRRLVANAMFERRIDMEYLRALVIGSYWLSDVSWTLSGYAIRRASEFHLRACYYQIVNSLKDPSRYTAQQLQSAIDGTRVLYLLYICDHHLSILYGRPSIMRNNEDYIFGWEAYLASAFTGDNDRRIASQLSLLLLMSQIRESFGPEDHATMLSESHASRIASFEIKLDEWISRWGAGHSKSSSPPSPRWLTSVRGPNKLIGTFPSKGIVIHYHFAKLYLESYVFRGLPDTGAIIPNHFLEMASAAVAAATSIVRLLIEDHELQMGLSGVPHYFHGMIAFACMFLLKVATRYRAQLFLNLQQTRGLIAGLSRQLEITCVGKDHLLHRMAEGLRRMAEMLSDNPERTEIAGKPDADLVQETNIGGSFHLANATGHTTGGQGLGINNELYDTSTLAFGDPVLGLGMPFFDFEGTSLDPDGTQFSLAL